ncbi:glucose-1-phosphate adenylyltransferase subunit GlgD [Schleiferilactobacillus harbinensis]|uniref:Glucose-1-phosphate adenylyltransferase subunit GlgD n=1 Tax=Schleiferilactobacillus harbinensis TaxID=304207 RepID=A0A5P8M7L4_9LACO|nr:glucose-1-phosphate adenylyltransferase subunit GlgD [Schleiferilactobacillus harbinensis]QFR24297.1 glucose-1-phosphate adenylyltransferase subunit GlgD [Schleiferilactobacillus harbinensis]
MRKQDMCAIIDLNEPSEALAPLTDERPVGTMPFAGRYRLVDFPLSAISNADIRTVGIFLPKSSRSVEDHVRSGQAWDMDTITGGVFTFPYVATRDYDDPTNIHRYYDNYLTFLIKSKSEYVFITGARHVSNIDVSALLQFHQASPNPITAVYRSVPTATANPEQEAFVLDADNEVVDFAPSKDVKERVSNHTKPISMQMYLTRTDYLIELLSRVQNSGKFIRLPQLIHQEITTAQANAFEYTGYCATIHDIPSYFQANMDMLDERKFHSLLFSQRAIYTKNKNEAPTYFAPEADVLSSLLGTGGRVYGKLRDSVLFRNVYVDHDAQVLHSIIMQGSRIGNGADVEYVIMDKGCVVGPDVKLIGTPEAPIVLKKGTTILDQSAAEEVLQS